MDMDKRKVIKRKKITHKNWALVDCTYPLKVQAEINNKGYSVDKQYQTQKWIGKLPVCFWGIVGFAW